MPRSPGEVQDFICMTCKKTDNGLCDEQPPGWAWKPVAVVGRNPNGTEKLIAARLELECFDHRPITQAPWEYDIGDHVPKERE